jgi:uncharacterized cupin superfamily protein/glyoxylase-like metal-dependent hydrolase (beta-lactamase superfamily II)
MQRTIIDGIAMWSRWQADRNLYFNSYFVHDGEENLIVDPLPLDDGDAAEIAAKGGAAWVVITNRDHQRAASDVAQHFGAKIAASEGDASALTVPVDRLLHDGDTIGGARVIALAGLKTAGEIALRWPYKRTVLVGDALWGDPAGAVRMMPDDKLADPILAARSLRKLRASNPRHLLVGDGTPVFGNAYQVISSYLETRGDAHVNVVNLDELTYQSTGGPGPYRDIFAEIGFVIGAEKLGYAVSRLEPGVATCPMHWHVGEEELFIVMEGTPTLETPHGSTVLRPGDFVAFPTREFGAHKVVNYTDKSALVIAIANTNPYDVCFYPDSRKVLVEATDTMVRSEPVLEYYDGEA